MRKGGVCVKARASVEHHRIVPCTSGQNHSFLSLLIESGFVLWQRESHSLCSGIIPQRAGELLPPLGHISSFPRLVSYIVKTTQRCVRFILDEDIFKVGVNIKTVQNLGTVHARPYVGEVTTKFRGGDWVDSCWAHFYAK